MRKESDSLFDFEDHKRKMNDAAKKLMASEFICFVVYVIITCIYFYFK
jgi:hypothetical protein